MSLEFELVRKPTRVEQAYIDAAQRQLDAIASAQAELQSQRQAATITTRRSTSHIVDGFVYVVESPSFPGWVKIGSTLDLKGRINSYQTYSPFADFQLSYASYFTNRMLAEADIHTILQVFRGKGEWFSVTPDQAKEVILIRQQQES